MNYFKILAFFTCLSNEVSAACNRIVTRQEIRSLSPQQRTAYFNAVKKLHSTSPDFFTSFCNDHNNNVPSAHGVPAFFPWHRHFLREFEKKLQAIDSSIVLPYWDWSRDAQAPERSPIFSSSYLGGNGASSGSCVTSGAFANWQVSVPNRHCLRRQFNGGSTISAFYSTEALETIINQAKSFNALRTNIEGGPHGSVHVGIGGNNGDMTAMYSPNDPIFYLHHAFVDLLWSEWQSRFPNLAGTYNGGSARLTDNMAPFNVRVQTVMKTSDLCYNYPRFGAALPRPVANKMSAAPSSGISSFVADVSSLASGFRKVDALDRSTTGKLRVPLPLPESFILMNNLNVNEVRDQEATIANLTMSLNAIPNFMPISNI